MSWESLAAITAEARTMAAEDAAREANPTSCPNDGTPLEQGPHGGTFCPFDGWRPGDPVAGDVTN